ncbi:MAG: VRR-NUC domain-containing protein [Rhodomicrobium sp.]
MRRPWRFKAAAGKKPRKKRLDIEHREQAAMYAEYLRRGAPDALFAAIPNGDHRSVSVAKRLKAEGVRAGMPDLIGITPHGLYWHEHKKVGGRVSGEQRSVHRQLRALGQTVEVSYGLAQGIAIMEKHGILTKAPYEHQRPN